MKKLLLDHPHFISEDCDLLRQGNCATPTPGGAMNRVFSVKALPGIQREWCPLELGNILALLRGIKKLP